MSFRVTTRLGGVSKHPFSSFNLANHVNDDPQAVAINRQKLQQQLGVRPVFMRQTHGLHCIEIDAKTPNELEADACVTISSEVACSILVADCLPVLFWSQGREAVGAAHAGWRGLVGDRQTNILQVTYRKLRTLLTLNEPIYAWLGPCIGFEWFEVGTEVAVHFDSAFKRPIVGGKRGQWQVNLAQAARKMLLDLGVQQVLGNDGLPSWCTATNEADYYSHRRDSARFGSTGRMAVCIWKTTI